MFILTIQDPLRVDSIFIQVPLATFKIGSEIPVGAKLYKVLVKPCSHRIFCLCKICTNSIVSCTDTEPRLTSAIDLETSLEWS